MKKIVLKSREQTLFKLSAWLLAWLFMPMALQAASKKIQVVCTLPTLRALTEEVGGDRVDVISLAKGDQDPHFVTPTPVLMKRTRDAALFIENGLSLELWADEVVNGFRADPAAKYKTPEQGAATSVFVATSPLLNGIGGRYLEDCNQALPYSGGMERVGVADYALDPDAAQRLWEISAKAVTS